jgi:hypothetical protein
MPATRLFTEQWFLNPKSSQCRRWETCTVGRAKVSLRIDIFQNILI